MNAKNIPLLDDTCRECRATRCDCCGESVCFETFDLRMVDPDLTDDVLDDAHERLEVARLIIDTGWPYRVTEEGLSFIPPDPEGPAIVQALRSLGVDNELIFEGLSQDETEWERVAVLADVGGSIAIGDSLGFAEDTEVLDLPPGDLCAEVHRIGCWNARLRLVLEPGGSRGDLVAEVGIHTGFIAVRDIDNAAHVQLSVKAGFGDGFYPVYEVLKGEELVGFEVVFIDQEDVGDEE